MTQTLAASAPVPPILPARVGLPPIGDRVVVRSGLEHQLEAAGDFLLTVIEAPTGAGKTLGVACWAASLPGVRGVLWLDVGPLRAERGSGGRERFWTGLWSGLIDLGVGGLGPPPAGSAPATEWTPWLADVAHALSSKAGPWLLVLDDYPIGATGALGGEVAVLLTATTNTRYLITCNGPPALDLGPFLDTGRLLHLRSGELAMNDRETAELLSRTGAPADPATVTAVSIATEGWAFGVDLAARALGQARDPRQVLVGLNRLVESVIERDVLSQLSARSRELIVRTSVSSAVSPGLCLAVMGEPAPDGWFAEAQGFVLRDADGSWRCHRLLRRTAHRHLVDDWPVLARDTQRAAARWHIDHGDRAAGLELAAEGGDWSLVSDALVSSLALVDLLSALGDETTARLIEQVEVAATVPLLSAVRAVTRGEPAVAESILASSTDEFADTAPYRLTEAIIRMRLARGRLDSADGLHWVNQCRRCAGELRGSRRARPELWLLLAAHEGTFLLWQGELTNAATALETAIQDAPRSASGAVHVMECTGLLAFLEAVRGNLTAAGRHAAEVLTRRPADGDEVGVRYAQLAAAWVHVERAELEQASQRLDHINAGRPFDDLWLRAAHRLARARIATLRGESDVALRILAETRRTNVAAEAAWLGARCTVAAAEAHLTSGDPQRAVAVLTPEPRHSVVEARVLAARARHQIGDRRGAQALLSSLGDVLAEAPLPASVSVWTLQARLASEADDAGRALMLLGRALRLARREDLRTVLSPLDPWLLALMQRQPDLAREHRSFLASMPRSGDRKSGVPEPTDHSGVVLEALTGRELQILERLAQIQTTDEIAADLFVSVNTVKTHIKSLFLKLSVNRRSDAVRRGRRLGLC